MPAVKMCGPFIQSGNVIFDSSAKLSARVPQLIAAHIETTLGYKTPLVLRSMSELDDAISSNPFLKLGGAEDSLYLMFLATVPDPSKVLALDPNRSPGDEYLLRGKEIYLRLTNGVADSKLTNAYFDSKLSTTSTARNWRTVTKLLELMRG